MTSGQLENKVTNNNISDNPLRWMYCLVYGMLLVAILLFFIAQSVILMKVITNDKHHKRLKLELKLNKSQLASCRRMTFYSL